MSDPVLLTEPEGTDASVFMLKLAINGSVLFVVFF